MQSISSELIKKVIESLKKNEMEAIYFSGVEETREEVLKKGFPPGRRWALADRLLFGRWDSWLL